MRNCLAPQVFVVGFINLDDRSVVLRLVDVKLQSVARSLGQLEQIVRCSDVKYLCSFQLVKVITTAHLEYSGAPNVSFRKISVRKTI